MTNALALAVESAGSIAELARGLGVTRSAICQWRRVPADRVLDVERLTGVSRHVLRPDIFGPPADVPRPSRAPSDGSGALPDAAGSPPAASLVSGDAA